MGCAMLVGARMDFSATLERLCVSVVLFVQGLVIFVAQFSCLPS